MTTNSKTNARLDYSDATDALTAIETSSSLYELFTKLAAKNTVKPFLAKRATAKAPYANISWQTVDIQVKNIAAYLQSHAAVKPGDRVAILSGTRLEWIVADLAVLACGATSVAVYPTLTAEGTHYILEDAQVEVVFAENLEQVTKLKSFTRKLSVITFEEVTPEKVSSGNLHLVSLEEIPSTLNPNFNGAHTSKRSDLATFVYTSGTTGNPKGVMQSHENHLAMLGAVLRSGLIRQRQTAFLFLPLAHSFARLIYFAVLAASGTIYFSRVTSKEKSLFDARVILSDIRDASPEILPAVPRIFEKIMSTLKNSKGLKRLMLNQALNSGVLAPIATRLIRQGLFGSQLKYCISGGAPINSEVVNFFKALGINILEGYGLTETTPAIAANTPDHWKIGTVGKPFDCNEVKIAADGEIIVRGKNIALGYWQKPEETAELFQADGWFHTGDIGLIDPAGFLKITDRKKELIVNSGGKKIAPAPIEGRLKICPLISQVALFGDNRPYLVALITLNLGVTLNPETEKSIKTVIEKLNSELAPFEQIKSYRLLTEDFTVENSLLTPTMKLKRKLIFNQYQASIDEMYRGH